MKNNKILFTLLFYLSFYACYVNAEDNYSKNILESSFIIFENQDYTKLEFSHALPNLISKDSQLFIYTPGSMSDDKKEDICSTFNEYNYLANIFFEINKKKIDYFYLNCSNNIEGDARIHDGNNFPYPYPGDSKHKKIRINLINLIEDFKKKGFKKNNIFLIGHSCGAWHSLYVLSQNPNLANAVIGFSPSCFGPRYLYYKREGFLRIRKNDIDNILNAKTLKALIFSDPDDIRESYLTLKWLKKIKGVKLIQTLKRKKNYYYNDSQVCKFESDLNKKRFNIMDGHNLHFSSCFSLYSNDILSFLEKKII